MSSHSRGVALIAASACGFGAMAIFAKYAYAAGADPMPLLGIRFVLAAALLWAVVAVRRPAWPARRVVAAALALGAIGYAAQAGLFFGAVSRVDASLASLLLYTYPVILFVAALALRRERTSSRKLAALGLATVGVAMLLLVGGTGPADTAGIAMGLGAALAYTGYILFGERLSHAIDPFLLSALVMTGATAPFAPAATGGIDAGTWPYVAGIVVISTVLPVVVFLAGLRRVGPATAGIVSTVEPVVTVGLAMACFGEALGGWQAAGGVLVLGAVVLLQWRARVPADEPAAEAARPAPARTLARQPA